jgi:hypothetical protein
MDSDAVVSSEAILVKAKEHMPHPSGSGWMKSA